MRCRDETLPPQPISPAIRSPGGDRYYFFVTAITSQLIDSSRLARATPRNWLSRSPQLTAIGGQRLESRIIDGSPDREMVERLPAVIADAQYPMDRVVEEAADSIPPQSGRLGFQINHLPNQTCFPKQRWITARSQDVECRVELCEHS